MWHFDFDRTFKLLGLLGAIGSFVWGVLVWGDNRQRELRASQWEQQRAAETRRVEATKPFLERQLRLYTEATQAAASIATSENPKKVAEATEQFWQLYWGELAMVEDRGVEGAMKQLGDALSASSDRTELQQLSLRLARACRVSLDRSWGINVWTQGGAAERPSEQKQ